MKAPIVTYQVQFSPLYLRPVSDGTFDLAQKLGHKPMIWSPVGGGNLLTSTDEKVVELRSLLTEIALRMGLPGPAEAAMAFVARHPVGGMPIVGSGKRERVDGAIQAVNAAFARDDWYEVVGLEPVARSQGVDRLLSADKPVDPVEATPRPARRDLPRRFYEAAGVQPVGDGFGLMLDGRQARTPGRNPLVVASPAVAKRWRPNGRDRASASTRPPCRLRASSIRPSTASRAKWNR